MKKLLLFFAVLATAITAKVENYILYTSFDYGLVVPNETDYYGNKVDFGANIISNTFENGQGKIVFDGEVTSIGDDAFYNNSNLESIIIPKSVKSIGGTAFANCRFLCSVTIPEGVTSIGNAAFAGCGQLFSIAIPASVTSLGERAFNNCGSLREVKLDVPAIVEKDYEKSGLSEIFGSQVTSYILGPSITKIGNSAFANCSKLTSVTLSEGVTSIGDKAFVSCGFRSIILPASLTSIGNRAFSGCGLRDEIVSLNVTPPTVGSSAFAAVAVRGIELKVPAEAVEAYKAAEGWSNFTNIVGIDLSTITSVKGEAIPGHIYDLSGRKMGEGFKGIVIQGGKKFIRR